MIDWSRVAELRQEIGAEDFDEVVEIFLEEVEEEILKLKPPVDLPNLESILHLLKGSALNLGFQSFSELCQRGEAAAALGSAGSVDVDAVVQNYHASKSEFLPGLSTFSAA